MLIEIIFFCRNTKIITNDKIIIHLSEIHPVEDVVCVEGMIYFRKQATGLK